jgi:hypothetical protein
LRFSLFIKSQRQEILAALFYFGRKEHENHSYDERKEKRCRASLFGEAVRPNLGSIEATRLSLQPGAMHVV